MWQGPCPELVGPAPRSRLLPVFWIVYPTSTFTCCEKPSHTNDETAKVWGGIDMVGETSVLPVRLSQGAFARISVFWAHSQPQGQRPRMGERSVLDSEIKKEAVRAEWSLSACILNVFSLWKKKPAKVMFLHKGSLCFIAILIYGPYIPVIVLNWRAK